MAKSQLGQSTGLEILASILRHCDAKTNRHIIGGLQKEIPQVAAALRMQIVMFDDLAFADSRGMQKLLKLVRVRDLSLALRGASQAVLKNIAANMSQRALADLKNEIAMMGAARESEVEAARERIMSVFNELLSAKELFINRPNEDMVY